MKEIVTRIARKALRSFGYEVRRLSVNPDLEKHAFDHTFLRLAHLKRLGFEPRVIFDVGASNGSWTLKCLPIFPDADYCCIEPLEEHRAALEGICQDRANISWWQGCLGSQPGSVIINVDGDGSSILSGHWGNSYGEQRASAVETLDTLVGQGVFQQPDLIKLDVQGYELEVLKGARESLITCQALLVETSFFAFQDGMPLIGEVIETVSRSGFALFDVVSLSLRPFDGSVGQSDILFLKTCHPLRQDNRWDIDSIY